MIDLRREAPTARRAFGQPPERNLAVLVVAMAKSKRNSLNRAASLNFHTFDKIPMHKQQKRVFDQLQAF